MSLEMALTKKQMEALGCAFPDTMPDKLPGGRLGERWVEIIIKLAKAGRSANQIAAAVGIHYVTAHYHLRQHGVTVWLETGEYERLSAAGEITSKPVKPHQRRTKKGGRP